MLSRGELLAIIGEQQAEIERLRAALKEIRGWREIGRDDVMRRIEEICEEALRDDEDERIDRAIDNMKVIGDD
jgi:trimethylamine:corrinoid methyltransferase-like protein